MPSAQMVVLDRLRRASSWSARGRGRPDRRAAAGKMAASAPSRLRPMTLRRVSLDSSTTLSSSVDDPGDVLGLGGRAVPVVDHLAVVHQLPGPLHRTDADEQQRQAEGQAEPQVLGVGAQRAEVEVPRPRHREVDDDEADRQQRNQAEERGDLAGGPVGGRLVDVGQPRQVLLDGPDRAPGSGDRPGSPVRRPRARPASGTRSQWSLRLRSLRRDPDRKEHQAAEAEDPGPQALAHRAEAAQRQAAVARAARAARSGSR